jgi:hypothetical protein
VTDLNLADLDRRARDMLGRFPLIDGHNDLPWALRDRARQHGGHASQVVFNLEAPAGGLHTDLPRLAAGGIGAQFWSVYVPASLAGDGAVTAVLEQIDLARRMIVRYPEAFGIALTADDVEQVFASGRVASLLGAEGGHAIAGSLGVLRALYALGVRYLTVPTGVSPTLPGTVVAQDGGYDLVEVPLAGGFVAELGSREYDEIILETPPAHVSHWLHVDLPQRLARLLAEDGQLQFSLNTNRQKVKNLQANPAVTVHIQDTTNPIRYLEVRGDARIEPDDDYVFAERLAAKYGGLDLRAMDAGAPGRRVVVTVEPSRINAIDLAAG